MRPNRVDPLTGASGLSSPVSQGEVGAGDSAALGGAGAAARAFPSVDALLFAPGTVGEYCKDAGLLVDVLTLYLPVFFALGLDSGPGH